MATTLIPISISGPSMLPTLKSGDVCYISFTDSNFGELICLRDRETKEIIIHRQLSHSSTVLKVKGDNALYWDDVSKCDYLGVVKKMKRGNITAIPRNSIALCLLSPYTVKKYPKVIRVFIKVLMRLAI